LEYLTTLITLGLLVAGAAFLWKNFGPRSGRSFGNKIASHNDIARSTFWYLVDNGAKGSALDELKAIEQSTETLEQASIALAPTLQRGLERLEARFGPQNIYELAKPKIDRLVHLSQNQAGAQESEQRVT
jgi:hypothetical protein